MSTSIINIKTFESFLINIINKLFPLLENNDKKLIIESISDILNHLYVSYFYEDWNINYFTNQMLLNEGQDILSLIVLLLPYLKLENSKKIKNLSEIYFNKNDFYEKNKDLECTYFIDHKDYFEAVGIKENEKIINSSKENIKRTISSTKNKLMVNWINIFPYTINDYKNSNLYKNFVKLSNEKLHNISDEQFYFGNENYYNCISNFLYDDIKSIKWLIYDIKIENTIYPLIILLSEYLRIENIINESLIILKENEKKYIYLKEMWNLFIQNTEYISIQKSLVFFYLRNYSNYSKYLKEILESDCAKIITDQTNKILDEDKDDNNENVIYFDDDTITNCIIKLIKKIEYDDVYEFIYKCMQQFKYTWYGYSCLSDEQIILKKHEFSKKYMEKYILPTDIISEKVYITPKIFYNYFKSFVHVSTLSSYIRLPKYWIMSKEHENLIINRFNNINTSNWFNIVRNLKRTHEELSTVEINKLMNGIINNIISKNYIVEIVLETMICNGILTYYKYNPKLSNLKILPNKNEKYSEWKEAIKNNLEITKYIDSYNFLNNMKLSAIPNYYETLIKDIFWVTNFGANWIAQIQTFHHFINQRTVYVTGGTGAGKSTIVPVMFLYGYKIIDYNNNGKIFCSGPRIGPVIKTAKRVSSQFGIILDTNKKSLNYISYHYQLEDTSDNYYHPSLTFLTDGILILNVKNNYMYKNKFSDKNVSDMVIVDESHEHNPNMDMILTLIKTNLYLNNQLRLSIISATMQDDEKIYRKFYEIIDDNWKYPLDLYNINDKNMLDRRLHLSAPLQTTNFKIEQIDEVGVSTMKILEKITRGNTNGDILVFQARTKPILQLISEINSNPMIPEDVLAVPLYKNLDDKIKKQIEEISDSKVRASIRFPKNYNYIDDIENVSLIPEGYYKRFIIVATNIVEASLTIDTLKYVIDDGLENNVEYDFKKDIISNKVEYISKSSQIQRRGRVGRTSSGTVYLTYDERLLSPRTRYKICYTKDIIEVVLDLVLNKNSFYIINKENDPNLLGDYEKIRLDATGTDTFGEIKEIIKEQYYFSNSLFVKEYIGLYNFFKNKATYSKLDKLALYYYDNTNKYSYEDLKADKFYIISPNENLIERDYNLDVIKYDNNYYNKILYIFNILGKYGLVNNGISTNFNDTIEKLIKFLDIDEVIELNDQLTLLYIIRLMFLYKDIDFQPILLFIIFKIKGYRSSDFKSSYKRIPLSDVLNAIYIVPRKYYDLIRKFKKEKINFDFSNYNDLILKYTNEQFETIIKSITINDNKTREYLKKIILMYNKIIIKLCILKDDKIVNKYNIKERFENIFLVRLKEEIIKVTSDKEIFKNTDIILSFNDYERFSYLSSYFYSSLIYIKIPETPFYYTYNYGDINNLSSIYSSIVEPVFLNKYINSLNNSDTISDLSYIPSNVIKSLLKSKENKGYNLEINKEEVNKEKMYYNTVKKNIGLIKNALIKI